MNTEARPKPLAEWPGVLPLAVAEVMLELTRSRNEAGVYNARCPLETDHSLRLKLLEGGSADLFCTGGCCPHRVTTYLREQYVELLVLEAER